MENIEPESKASEEKIPEAPRFQHIATPLPSSVEHVTHEEPLIPSATEVRHFFTRGKIIGTIAVLLLVSFALDRFPAKAPRTASSPDSNQLAIIGASAPGPENLARGTVTVYFNNGILDPSMMCEKVFPVKRETENPSPDTAVELLLAGPTTQELNAGYFTSISPDMKIKNVGIDNDVAAADFEGSLAYNIQAGSCRARAIRAQVSETLQQFTGVRGVKILLDGNERNIFAQ